MSDPRGWAERSRGRRGSPGTAAAVTAVLLAVMAVAGLAQSPGGSLTGKLTDLHSKPLTGVTVTLKNTTTGAAVHTLTGKGGAYRFVDLPAGEYSVQATSRQFGEGAAGGVEVLEGHESRVQTAVALSWNLVAPGLADGTAWANAVEVTRLPATSTPSQSGEVSTLAFGGNLKVAANQAPKILAADSTALLKAERPAAATLSLARGSGVTEASGRVRASAEIGSPVEKRDKRELIASVAEPGLPPASSGAGAIVLAVKVESGSGVLAMAAAVAVSISQAEAILLAADSANAGAAADFGIVLTGEQMEQLPLPGRRWENLVLDTSATGNESDEVEAAQTGPERSRSAVTVGGASTQLAFGGSSWGRRSTAALAGSETSIREFRVSGVEDAGSNFATGERVHLETRRGGRGLHGQGFVFNRQGLWGAQNPLTQWVKESAPSGLATVPQFTAYPYSSADRENRWGGRLGGDALKHRLSWFGNVDGSERDHPSIATVKHPDHFFAQPSNDEMQVLSARLGLSAANPVAEGVKAYSGMIEALAGLLGPVQRTSRTWSTLGRLDWRGGARYGFTLEGSGSIWAAPGGGFSRASETVGSHSFGGTRGSSSSELARWETHLTPSLVAITQGSFRRVLNGAPAATPSPFEEGFNANGWSQLPQMTVDSRYGFTIGNPARFGPGFSPDERVFEAQESLNWAHRGLQMRAGFDWRHSADETSFLRNHTGTYVYSSLENFVSDALVFAKYGLTNALDPMQQHNCDQRGKAWRDATGQLHGLGYLPCYSHYTQTLGPTEWHLSTNDLAGFVTTQWQPAKKLLMTAGLRWDRENLPPPILLVNNPELPQTQHLPTLGSSWSPRFGLVWGRGESRWPVLRAGYGMYAGRTSNRVIETVLTETGSAKGDLNYLMRPTDNLPANGGGAPPFPYVLGGKPASAEKPGVVDFAPRFKNAEIQQAVVATEERLPGRILISVSALVSLARRLPVTTDTNYDPATNPKTITYAVVDGTGKGPIKASQITVPFFASWPGFGAVGGRTNGSYRQLQEIASRANSTYEAATVSASRSGRNGLSFHARYTYGHTTDWNPNEGVQATRSSVFDPTNFALEYGTSNLDQRHTVSSMSIWQAPWHHKGAERWLTDGWMLSGTAQFHSGLPYTMHTAGSITRVFETNGSVIVGLGPGMNGFGGDDRVYGVGRNTFRYPHTWKADARVGRRFAFGHGREMEILAESFNLFNHQNVTQVETTGYSIEPGNTSGSAPTLNFLTGLKNGRIEFGQPLNINAVDFYRERQFDLGLRMRF